MKDKLNNKLRFKQKGLWPLLLLLFYLNGKCQIANYISNGSFEEAYDCYFPNPISKAKQWLAIDSSSYAGLYISSCSNYNLVPYFGFDFQYPRSGNAYAYCTFFHPGLSVDKGYLKNRLKRNLQAGTAYCVKFFVNIANTSLFGIDGFGIYFGDSSIDTITKCVIPLTYINPQVKNPDGNVITDTLNWIAVTGTFVASGTEKYALIGNFKPDSTLGLVNVNWGPDLVAKVCIDDVSCIPLNLPAFAANDTTCIAGTSVYIGRQRDVGIDEACMWYKLPIVITPTTPALDTAAGIWVSPTQTSTYVVRQEICGIVKWDTVVVRQDWTGLKSYNLLDGVSIYPNPASDHLFFKYPETLENERMSLRIIDLIGASIREEEIQFRQRQLSIDVQSLSAGTYFAILKDRFGVQKYEKLIIER